MDQVVGDSNASLSRGEGAVSSVAGSWRASQRHRSGWMQRVVLEDKAGKVGLNEKLCRGLGLFVDAEETLEMLEEGAL